MGTIDFLLAIGQEYLVLIDLDFLAYYWLS